MQTDRLHPDPRHLPDNIVPFDRKARRSTPRWLEWTREHQTERTASADLSGYIKTGGEAA